MSKFNETVRLLLGFGFAFFLEAVCFGFLGNLLRELQDPDLVAVDAAQIGIIIGAIVGLMTSAATFVFGQAIMSAAARSASTATQAGVNAALTQPPQPTITAESAPEP